MERTFLRYPRLVSLSSPENPTWQVRMDTGGTFTDVVAIDPHGHLHRLKILSTGRVRGRLRDGTVELPLEPRLLANAAVHRLLDDRPIGHLLPDGRLDTSGASDASQELVDVAPGLDAPRLGLHLVTGTPIDASLPSIDLRLATTRATNALLEGRLARVLLVTTEGFEDLVAIGDQSRPDLFAPEVRPRRLVPAATIGLPREIADLAAAMAVIEDALDRHRPDAIAIALLHAWRDPSMEIALGESLRLRHPDLPTSIGTETSPGIRLVPRVRSTVADAALSPIIRRFLDDVAAGGDHIRTLVSTSQAGLVPAVQVRPGETLLSGPAAGILGAVSAARFLTDGPIVGFDMGGTSTDVARAGRTLDLRDETIVGDAIVRSPAVDLHTVAAGGGSICRVVDDRLEVGPESAGATPGPACYGAGGPLAITDVNLLLGRADPDRFGVPLDLAAARAALDAIAVESGRDADDLLRGFADLADERMAEAIRTITTRRGVDPADHLLVAFGGAGGQHACGVADRLAIERILVPPDAGLLSAVGLGRAVRERGVERTLLVRLDDAPVADLLAEAERDACTAASELGVEVPVVRRRQWRCRLVGQDATIDLDLDATDAGDSEIIAERFRHAFETLYGHEPPDRPIELAAVRVFAGDPTPPNEPAAPAPDAPLPPGATARGPSFLPFDSGTAFVADGWTATGTADGGLVLERISKPPTRSIGGPAATEIVACRLESIARDMGETLRRTALSVNVKERLDYSCGIVDRDGRLVVNAPHMPVHLGAMGDCVRRVLEVLDPAPGDTVLVNHPAFGGSHLPDLTVVTPVHTAGGRRIGFVVNRAHHAEIGGTRPGSMPPDATRLVEEGVVFEPMRVVAAGESRLDEVAARLRAARHPSRAVEENLADLAAQIAANRLGAERLRAVHDAVGSDRFDADLESLRRRCASAIATLAARLDGVDRTIRHALDDGTPLAVRLEGRDGRLRLDFTGTGGVHPGNLNAPAAVVRAAVLYTLRVVAGEPIPLNEGALEVVDLIVPEGLLAPPFTGDPDRDPAVAIGNTETSQRVVNLLLEAFGAVAASQGTMNNLLLGDDTFGYYETICGGTGAGPGFDGASAVHSHMTNTRITDPEVLEVRYPMRLDEFSIRRGSGGAGRHRGGDGVIRAMTALRPLRGSLLGQHRVHGPRGLAGGHDGAPASARIERADGSTEHLPGIAAFDLGAGDRLVIETPGGGGFERPGH